MQLTCQQFFFFAFFYHSVTYACGNPQWIHVINVLTNFCSFSLLFEKFFRMFLENNLFDHVISAFVVKSLCVLNQFESISRHFIYKIMCRDVMMSCHFAKSKSAVQDSMNFSKKKLSDDDWNKYYEDKVSESFMEKLSKICMQKTHNWSNTSKNGFSLIYSAYIISNPFTPFHVPVVVDSFWFRFTFDDGLSFKIGFLKIDTTTSTHFRPFCDRKRDYFQNVGQFIESFRLKFTFGQSIENISISF